MNSSLYEFVESSMTEPTFIPLLSVKVNIRFAQFVIDYLSMVLLFDAYTEHNANTSRAPWGGSLFPQKRTSGLETSQKVICFKKIKKC